MKIATLILAAGSSSRMGKPKQLLPWGNTTLLGSAIQVAKNSSSDIVLVVLGAKADLIRKKIEPFKTDFIVNEAWEMGLGGSIAKGVSYLVSQTPQPHAILIMLADQPLVTSVYLDELISNYQQGRGDIICTSYESKLGVPALFDKKYFTELALLQGDNGAGKLIRKHRKSSFSLNAGDKVKDLDTPEDYISLKAIKTKSDP
ncbi:nucleotidyltransferase family protein [Muriicola soli]|uniref:Nucleotidyltransferase family protein n=1 Tax=Muriicola soli TaxID=2507538 RepID=A0A411E8X8_9FLAO|nr:nucleotidyltransferase family protein [Muriicola soli]QBA64171.1 nucleotidyltransferase family protein [Muriicola soli]